LSSHRSVGSPRRRNKVGRGGASVGPELEVSQSARAGIAAQRVIRAEAEAVVPRPVRPLGRSSREKYQAGRCSAEGADEGSQQISISRNYGDGSGGGEFGHILHRRRPCCSVRGLTFSGKCVRSAVGEPGTYKEGGAPAREAAPRPNRGARRPRLVASFVEQACLSQPGDSPSISTERNDSADRLPGGPAPGDGAQPARAEAGATGRCSGQASRARR